MYLNKKQGEVAETNNKWFKITNIY